MPLAAEEHGPASVHAFLWGLLPDNERVLDRWAKKFQVSARSAFALISHVGEDCAGAVQFVTPDRLEALKGGKDDQVEWLDEPAIAKRLQTLRKDPAAWRLPRDAGQFSLAGAQPKPLFCCRMVDGVFRPDGFRPRISSSRRRAILTATPRTSISASTSPAVWGCLSRKPG
jgi:hypothetical protein